MAGARAIQAIGGSYSLADRKAACQRSVNLYMQEIEGLGEDKTVILRGAPGLTDYLSFSMTLRAAWNADGRWFVVSGNTLYETTTGVSVFRGNLTTSAGYVGMAHGTSQLVMVDGPNGYVFNLTTNTFARITDPDWRGSAEVAFVDGYFVFVAPDTEQFYISAIDDASTLDALDFSSADRQPDNIITHRAFKGELYFCGSRTIEPWINSGGSDFPFSRYNATPVEVGVVGPRAICEASDALVFVGQTARGRGYVYAMAGYQPTRISTRAVEEALAASTDLSACVLWTYHDDTGEFVGIEAPGLSTTWVFDFATRQWHERCKLVSGEEQRLALEGVSFFGGEHYALNGADLCRLDGDAYTICGDVMRYERTWPHLVSPSLEPVNYRGLELACVTGTEGAITLEISNDGGSVFGAPIKRSLGATGQRMQRVRWLGLGSSRDRVFRLRCSSAVQFSLHAATVEAA